MIIVVLVLMTNCQVSENLNSGPEIPQSMTIAAAPINVFGEPTTSEAILAKLLKPFCFTDRLEDRRSVWLRI